MSIICLLEINFYDFILTIRKELYNIYVVTRVFSHACFLRSNSVCHPVFDPEAKREGNTDLRQTPKSPSDVPSKKAEKQVLTFLDHVPTPFDVPTYPALSNASEIQREARRETRHSRFYHFIHFCALVVHSILMQRNMCCRKIPSVIDKIYEARETLGLKFVFFFTYSDLIF